MFALVLAGVARGQAQPATEAGDPSPWSAGGSLGWGIGTMASKYKRDLVLANLRVAKMLGTPGQLTWGGQFEFGGELFSMTQFSPGSTYVVGAMPMVRYYFGSYSTWRVHLDAGAGICQTDFGLPDLSTKFEFNEQVGPGVMWNVRRDLAVALNYRFSHISNAGIREPNSGVNGHLFSLGVCWRF